MTEIKLENVSKSYRDLSVLNNISFSVSAGDFVSLIGFSGSGKSTVLKLIAGLEKPTQGEITFSSSPRLSFVFQDPCLLPWKTVEENILVPFELLNETPVNSSEVLELVGLTEFRNYFPHQLSGGMKMRVSIARALITNPDLLLLDEPFAALDEVTRFKLQDDVNEIWRKKKMTTVFVTHSISEATYLSNRVLLLDKETKSIKFSLNIELGANRIQSLKSNSKYINYVTEISSELKGKLL